MAWWGLLLILVWVQKNIITLQTLVNSLLAWALVNPIIYKVSPKIQYSKFVGQYFLFCLVDFEYCEYASVITARPLCCISSDIGTAADCRLPVLCSYWAWRHWDCGCCQEIPLSRFPTIRHHYQPDTFHKMLSLDFSFQFVQSIKFLLQV